MENSYDILIAGGGPIGAATAFSLARRNSGLRIALITEEAGGEPPRAATYRFSGGSVRMWWTDPQTTEMTAQTAALIEALDAQGVDIDAVRDRYVLIHRGLEVPSWNISAPKLVSYFLSEAERSGLQIARGASVESLESSGRTHMLRTSQGTFFGRKILLALGSRIPNVLRGAPFVYKKRELLVCDLPVTPDRERFPHTVVPLGEGLVFVFVKKLDGAPKFMLGQEDIVSYSDSWEEENFLPALAERGLYALMPFLKNAGVEKILWGFDAERKTPQFYAPEPGILAVTCGSAVRSSAWIGEETARRLLEGA